jgi:chorismate lyase
MLPQDRDWRRRPVGADSRWQYWLVNRGLLTARIQERCARFSLRRLFQGPAKAGLDERFVAEPRTGRVLVREIALHCGAKPVVFAHSVVRARHLRGAWRGLASLGSRPLGAALFNDPRVRRYPMRFRKLGPRHALHMKACRVAGRRLPALWARRTLYVLRQAPILVTEVFLPELLQAHDR